MSPATLPSNTTRRWALLASATAFLLPLPCRTCLAGGVDALPPADTAAFLQRVRPALAVLVSTDRRGQWKSFGTGFFISDDGALVTARHVAQSQENLLAITQDGQRHPVIGFLGEDRDHDLAVLKVNGRGRAHLRLAPALPETNQWVVLASPTDQWPALFHQTNIFPTGCTGAVSSIFTLPGLWTGIITTIAARPGQSGSPLLDQTGQVIGVAAYVGTEHQATASPAAVARAILQKAEATKPIAFGDRPRNGGASPLVMDPDFRAGCEAMSRGDWKGTERRMKRAARRFRESAVPLAILAAACAQRTAWKEVHVYCKKALEIQPDSGFTRLLEGTSLVMLGHLPEGTAQVRKSLELGLPEPAMQTSAWRLVATAEVALGHRAQAQNALNNLARLDPAAAAALRDQLEAERRPKPDAKTL